ncbi:MAG: DUF1792 domain-containing protein [Prevotella sp.]|nr:DUF1792 domain-containing protein [Prevotella sp.]
MRTCINNIFIRIYTAILRRIDRYYCIPNAQKQFVDINILDSLDSIKYIIENKCSLSRFGDGEFDIILGKNGNTFQVADEQLAERLKQVLMSNDVPNHVVGIPFPMKSTKNLRESSAEFWGYYALRYSTKLMEYIKKSKRSYFLDTQLSRFYIMYKKKIHCKEQFSLLKQIWDNREIVIVEGCKSRTGIGNDLYDNAKSVQRIIGLPINAWAKYNEMLNAIKENVSKDKLILLSYGMTATVLAYDLAKLGYWAIDIGHLDIEYEWFLSGAKDNMAIKGKFTNEAKSQGGHIVEDCNNQIYLNQIICDITRDA